MGASAMIQNIFHQNGTYIKYFHYLCRKNKKERNHSSWNNLKEYHTEYLISSILSSETSIISIRLCICLCWKRGRRSLLYTSSKIRQEFADKHDACLLRHQHDRKVPRTFGNLWIGSHPTPQQGKYQVLYLDFSKIGGGIKLLEDRFNDYCGQCVDFFVDTLYKDYYTPEAIAKIKGINYASGKLNALAMEAQKNGYQLFLIVDEYDNFTNVVLNEHGEDMYWALTHASGFYREIFKVFKGMFARIFMTGVSPVTLDDLTSGFNIGWHISTKAPFNQMLGFSTEDVRDLFTYYKNSGDLPADTDVEAIIEDMKPWYDNYCFQRRH